MSIGLLRRGQRRKRGRIPKYTVLKCRAGGRHQVGWCFRMCQPVNGRGLCGRIAPHALKGNYRRVMELHSKNQEKQAS